MVVALVYPWLVGRPARAAYGVADVLIVGAGPSGLAAALAAARSGARVIVADEMRINRHARVNAQAKATARCG